MWKLNSVVLNSGQRINLKGKQRISQKKYGNTTSHNLRGPAETVLRGRLTAINANIKKLERSQIITLTLAFKELEKRNKLSQKLAEGRKSSSEEK